MAAILSNVWSISWKSFHTVVNYFLLTVVCVLIFELWIFVFSFYQSFEVFAFWFSFILLWRVSFQLFKQTERKWLYWKRLKHSKIVWQCLMHVKSWVCRLYNPRYFTSVLLFFAITFDPGMLKILKIRHLKAKISYFFIVKFWVPSWYPITWEIALK